MPLVRIRSAFPVPKQGYNYWGGWGGAHDKHGGRELLGGFGGMLPWETFKNGVSEIAFPAFWEQFPAIFDWLKSSENRLNEFSEDSSSFNK